MVNYNIKRFCWVFGVLLIALYLLIVFLRGHVGDYMSVTCGVISVQASQ